MNKTQLVDALAARLGDRRTAASAVDGVLDIIVDTVGSGGSVTLTGFGVFEARARAARVARNPRTGETVPVPPTTVPAFRPGTAFRTTVAGNDGAAATAKKAPARSPRPATRAARSSGSFAAEEAVAAPAPKKTARSTAAKATATKAKATEKAPVKAAAKPAAKKTTAKEAVKEAAAKVVKDKPAKKAKAKK